MPKVLGQNTAALLGATGTLAFSVHSAGEWTVDLGNPRHPVRPGFAAQADLCLWFSETAFAAFLAGDLAQLEAERPDGLRHLGDLSLLAHFAKALAPGPSILTIRTLH